MIKNLCEPEDNSDGSEDEEMPENNGSDEEMETDEEPAGSGDEQDQENENEENDEENEEDEEEEEEEDESSTHPYPTPPPDAVTDDAKANMSLGNGMKKIKIGGSSKPKVVKEKKSKMAASNTDPATDAAKSIKGKTILDLAINAIKALDSKSGSSVISIVAYIKSSGYEMEDQQRFSKTLYKRLKVAVEKGEIEKVKNSFRISMEAKKKSVAIEKMKQKQQREKLKLKEAEDKKAKKVQEKEKKQAKQTKEKEKEKEKKKQKATERKTKEVSTRILCNSVYHIIVILVTISVTGEEKSKAGRSGGRR